MRKCPYCESLVKDESTSCSFCGKELGVSSPGTEPTSSTHPGYGSRNCVACGRPIQFDASVCPYCGHDYRIPLGMPGQTQKTWKPAVGGALVIVAGILAIAMGAMYMTFDASDIESLGVTLPAEYTAEDIAGMLTMCGAVLFVFAIIAIIGGIFGIRRKYFALAIAGGVFGLLGIGFFLGSVLALVGLILLAVSRNEFR